MTATAEQIPEIGERDLVVPTAEVFAPLTSPARYKGAHGGRGSGKSYHFADQLITRGAFSDTRAVCLREYQTSLTHSVKALLEFRAAVHGVSHRYNFKKSHIEGRYNNTLMIFQGMQVHNSESIKSLEDFDIAWFEEAHRASATSIEMLRPTIRRPGSELWFSWNRTNRTDPVEELFGFGDKEAPDNAICVEANWRDNPFLTQELLDEMRYDRRRDKDRYAHIWEGKYQSQSEARVFKNWQVAGFEIDQLVRQGDDISGPYFGGDWGFANDPTVLVCLYVDDPNKKVYIRHEAWGIGIHIHKTKDLFLQVPEANRHQIIADSARPETIAHLRDVDQFNIVPAKKGPNSVKDGVEFLKSYDIYVHPECRHCQDELTHYSYKVDKLTQKPTNVLEDKKNHVIDAMRYALENVRRGKHDFY